MSDLVRICLTLWSVSVWLCLILTLHAYIQYNMMIIWMLYLMLSLTDQEQMLLWDEAWCGDWLVILLAPSPQIGTTNGKSGSLPKKVSSEFFPIAPPTPEFETWQVKRLFFSCPLWVSSIAKGSHPSKNTVFLWNTFANGAGGSIGFHISYSEIVNTPKSVATSEKGFHKYSTGGAGHRFMKVFHKKTVFFEGWLPLWYLSENMECHIV